MDSGSGEGISTRAKILEDPTLAGRARQRCSCGGLIDEVKKRLAERMWNAEMDHIWAMRGGEAAAGNHRNCYSSKTVLTDTGRWSCRFHGIGMRTSTRVDLQIPEALR